MSDAGDSGKISMSKVNGLLPECRFIMEVEATARKNPVDAYFTRQRSAAVALVEALEAYSISSSTDRGLHIARRRRIRIPKKSCSSRRSACNQRPPRLRNWDGADQRRGEIAQAQSKAPRFEMCSEVGAQVSAHDHKSADLQRGLLHDRRKPDPVVALLTKGIHLRFLFGGVGSTPERKNSTRRPDRPRAVGLAPRLDRHDARICGRNRI